MKIITGTITLDELKKIAADMFGNLVKAVVDIDKCLIALDAELHSDLKALLLENGSRQNSLSGINLYPEKQGDDYIEFDSLINLRPSQGNSSRGVDDAGVRQKVIEVINRRIKG